MYGNPIVVRTSSFRSWLKRHFTKQELKEMATYGATSGYCGLIDYRDMSRIYERFKDEIYECMLVSFADLAEFTRRVEPRDIQDLEQKLTWLAAETIAWEMAKGRKKKYSCESLD